MHPLDLKQKPLTRFTVKELCMNEHFSLTSEA